MPVSFLLGASGRGSADPFWRGGREVSIQATLKLLNIMRSSGGSSPKNVEIFQRRHYFIALVERG